MRQGQLSEGTVVYFKKCKTTSRRKGGEYLLTGVGFGVLLGEVKPGNPDPPLELVVMKLGQIGYVRLDDVGVILGEAVRDDLVKKLQELYTEKMKLLALRAKPPSLVSSNGTPIISDPEKPEPTV